ncbi:hypothetical protein [Priestia aryabhattai]
MFAKTFSNRISKSNELPQYLVIHYTYAAIFLYHHYGDIHYSEHGTIYFNNSNNKRMTISGSVTVLEIDKYSDIEDTINNFKLNKINLPLVHIETNNI